MIFCKPCEYDTLYKIAGNLKKNIYICNDYVKYEDVFSRNVLKQKQATELYQKLLEIRNEILNSQPEAVTGPLHSFAKAGLYCR